MKSLVILIGKPDGQSTGGYNCPLAEVALLLFL
jgi:hypothetical protein